MNTIGERVAGCGSETKILETVIAPGKSTYKYIGTLKIPFHPDFQQCEPHLIEALVRSNPQKYLGEEKQAYDVDAFVEQSMAVDAPF
ncbi:MAG: hypothetical protein AAFN77_16815 [Planctomycetota bacterium]